MKLTEKKTKRKLRQAEKQFVDNIVAGHKQTVAYQMAYPNASPETASANASRKLADANIQAAIQRRKQEAAELAGVTPAMVIGGMNEIAFGSLADIPFTEFGTIDWDLARARGVDHLIKSIRITQTVGGTVSTHYEMYSRLDALKELGDYLGIKQKPRENDAEIEKIARAYSAWCETEGKDAQAERREIMLQHFAKGGAVPVEALKSRVEAVQELGAIDNVNGEQ